MSSLEGEPTLGKPRTTISAAKGCRLSLRTAPIILRQKNYAVLNSIHIRVATGAAIGAGIGDGGVGPFAAVLWRAEHHDLTAWTRTTQLAGGAGPFMTGVEFSIHALADDTVIVLTGLPENCTHYRSTDGGHSFATQSIDNCTRCPKTAACWRNGKASIM